MVFPDEGKIASCGSKGKGHEGKEVDILDPGNKDQIVKEIS